MMMKSHFAIFFIILIVLSSGVNYAKAKGGRGGGSHGGGSHGGGSRGGGSSGGSGHQTGGHFGRGPSGNNHGSYSGYSGSSSYRSKPAPYGWNVGGSQHSSGHYSSGQLPSRPQYHGSSQTNYHSYQSTSYHVSHYTYPYAPSYYPGWHYSPIIIVHGGHSSQPVYENLPEGVRYTSTLKGSANNKELIFTNQRKRQIYQHEIEKISEDLLRNDVNNAFKYIKMNLQGNNTNGNTTANATIHFLNVTDDAWKIPTIKNFVALHDNYKLDGKVKDFVLREESAEEDTLIDSVVDTYAMKKTMKFLIEKGYISDNILEFKTALKIIWFTQIKISGTDMGYSAFEWNFLAKKINSTIYGVHNWIYYAKKEANKELTYLGYNRSVSLGDKGAIVDVSSRLSNITINGTVFVGASPELEMSLYTLCFYVCRSYKCPLKLNGQQVWMPPPPPPVQLIVHEYELKNAGISLSSNTSKIYLLVLFILFKLY